MIRERETRALADFLEDWPTRFSSVVAAVEVPRAARRARDEAVPAAEEVLELVNLIELDRPVVETAAALQSSALRTLDAIHLASAISLGELVETFVTYDARLRSAVARAGLEVSAPA